MRLKNASQEELDDLARKELESVVNELEKQKALEEKVDHLTDTIGKRSTPYSTATFSSNLNRKAFPYSQILTLILITLAIILKNQTRRPQKKALPIKKSLYRCMEGFMWMAIWSDTCRARSPDARWRRHSPIG